MGFIEEGSEQTTFDGAYKCIVDVWNCVDRVRIIEPDGTNNYEWVAYPVREDDVEDGFEIGGLDFIAYHQAVAEYTLMARMLSEGYETAKRDHLVIPNPNETASE